MSSLRSTNTGSLRDRAVIDPKGFGVMTHALQGFNRDDGGGGNRTRVPTLWPNHRKGREPLGALVTGRGGGS